MNILIHDTIFFSPSSVGGGEVVFSNFVKGMARSGHEIDVICHRVRYDESDDNTKLVSGHGINSLVEYKGETNLHRTKHLLRNQCNFERFAGNTEEEHQYNSYNLS